MYTYNGADILINVAAWPKSRLHHYQALARARAIENQIFFSLSSNLPLRQAAYPVTAYPALL